MKILAAIDLSAATDKVLEAARQSASLAAAELWLLHVVEPEPAFVGFDPGPQTVRDQVAQKVHKEHEALQRHAAALRDSGIKTTGLVVQGPTSDTILREAEKLGTDLIVVGSHGHGAMYQMLVGSVSEGVIRGAKCPVLVVPTHKRA